MATFLRAAILIALMLSVQSAFAAHTYYISKSLGADSNSSAQSQSKTTPWAHLPGMSSCTSNCASYSPSAGDQFILYGGDTWTNTDLGVNWQWSGSSGSSIYIGVDQTWHSGSSWTRPIFNCETTSCGNTQFGNVIWIAGDYVIFDNIEMTGYQQSGGGNMVGVYGNNNTVENFYIHGWSRTAGSGGVNSFALNNNASGGGGNNTLFTGNVIDGSDSPNKDFMGGILHGVTVSNNVIRYVYNGMNGGFHDVHGNLVEYNYISTSGDHCNMVFIQGPSSGTTTYVYNNIIRHSGCGGGSTLWLLGNANCSSCVTYAYNNVIYDTAGDFDPVDMPIGNHPGNPTGTFYLYNNTLEAGGADAMGNGETPPRATVSYSNNHFINVNSPCLATGVTCTNSGTNVTQTAGQAATAGYTSSQTYAYSPTSSSSPTVGAGSNLTSLCSGNLVTLCSDTTYATYDSVKHVVVLRQAVPRPASGAWDVGAYQLSLSTTAPNPPTGLTATVQ
jgi:hypothetical protein